jgi:hypothetical protein
MYKVYTYDNENIPIFLQEFNDEDDAVQYAMEQSETTTYEVAVYHNNTKLICSYIDGNLLSK